MAIGFYAGGAIAGRDGRTTSDAFNRGVVVASITIATIFVADMVRRLVLPQTSNLIWLILLYWMGALITASIVGGLGAVIGRRRIN
jgi:hypothetical protein